MSENELMAIKEKLKKELVEALSLEDVEPDEIVDDEPLFGEGLGLDSLDGVEIVVVLQRSFGVELADIENKKEVFYSIDTLSNFILENKK